MKTPVCSGILVLSPTSASESGRPCPQWRPLKALNTPCLCQQSGCQRGRLLPARGCLVPMAVVCVLCLSSDHRGSMPGLGLWATHCWGLSCPCTESTQSINKLQRYLLSQSKNLNFPLVRFLFSSSPSPDLSAPFPTRAALHPNRTQQEQLTCPSSSATRRTPVCFSEIVLGNGKEISRQQLVLGLTSSNQPQLPPCRRGQQPETDWKSSLFGFHPTHQLCGVFMSIFLTHTHTYTHTHTTPHVSTNASQTYSSCKNS
jgi:hypothetical protein